MNLLRRNLLVAGLGASALPFMSAVALADQKFTTYPFPATGEPTSRTMPDRLAEIKNVLDFGADPTGGVDSSAAIQAAVNWTTSPNRGTIFFPQGSYKISNSITFNGVSINDNLSIRFLGVGGGSTLFTSGLAANSYIFDRHSASPNNTTGLRVFEGLQLQNGNDSGGCIRIGSTNGAVIRDCRFSGFNCVTTEDAAGVSSQNIMFDNCTFVGTGTGTLGGSSVTIGGAGAAMSCDSRNNDTGWRIYGNGFNAFGCRNENVNTGFMVGVDSANTNQGASGFSFQSCSFEGDTTGIYLKGTCTGFFIGACGAQGHDAGNSGYPIGANATKYGLRIDADMAQGGVVQNYQTSSVFDVAGVSIANATSRTNLVLLGVIANESGGAGVPWVLPTNAYTALFYQCNTQPIWTFLQLPSGGNVLEGDEFNISDSNTATWGATVAGSGSTHGLVRWNGTNWTLVGK